MKAKPKMIVTLAWNVILVYRVTKTAKSVYDSNKPTVCFTIVFKAVKMKTQTTSKKCQYKLTINNLEHCMNPNHEFRFELTNK